MADWRRVLRAINCNFSFSSAYGLPSPLGQVNSPGGSNFPSIASGRGGPGSVGPGGCGGGQGGGQRGGRGCCPGRLPGRAQELVSVRLGLVDSLQRPTDNLTGLVAFSGALGGLLSTERSAGSGWSCCANWFRSLD